MIKANLTFNYLHAPEPIVTYGGKGKTVFDALSNIPLTWREIKLKGTIEVTDRKRKALKMFYAKQLRILFANPGRRQGWARQFEILLR